MTFKPVFRRDGTLIRLFRFVWQRGTMGRGGYSCKLSFGVCPVLFRFCREYRGFLLTIAGLRIHFMKDFGGVFC